MLIEYFENLRKRSPEAKKVFAIGFTCTVTGLIIVVWLFGLFINDFGNRSPDDKNLTNGTQIQNITTKELFNNSNVFLDNSGT